MKYIRNKLNLFLLLGFAIPYLGSAQVALGTSPGYDVYRVYPALSLTSDELAEALTIMDLNRYYKSSWVKEYVSVEVSVSHDGELLKAINRDAELSRDQKRIMTGADVGSEISVDISYIPENTLKHNDVKSFDFTFTIEPEHEARYPGGESKLKQYLKDQAIDGIPNGMFENLDLAAVRFTVDEEGQIVGARMFEPSKDEKVDALLIDAVTNMSSWQPAEYADGTKVRQDFVLTVGSMENCMVNLLNIRLDQ